MKDMMQGLDKGKRNGNKRKKGIRRSVEASEILYILMSRD